MENVCFASLCCCLLILAGTEGQSVRDLRIENCIYRVIDIRENANNTILCKGFYPNDTIVWKFKRIGEKSGEVATCAPSSDCTVHQPDHFAVERSPSHSTLFYQQYDRQVDALASVFCESQFAGGPTSTICTLNVINPAKLSSCTVEEDRDNRTLRGSCRFDHAYSHIRGFRCTWYQKLDGESRSFHGNITYDSGPQSQGGWCTFTSTDLDREPGTYTYIINFYPGPGNTTVKVGNIDDPVTGEVEIENCNENVTDILEQANNTIVCRGLNPHDTIRWTFSRNGLEIPVATCDPTNCTVHQSDHFAVERSPSHSTLFYQQYDRQVDRAALVTCRSQFEGASKSTSCMLNVINPAELSNCTVEEDRDSGTVRGSCRFQHALSDRRGFSCTWYQETDRQSKRFSGNITYHSGSQGPGGWCTFTTIWEPVTYTYSILFYPGPGNITVNMENIETKTPKPIFRTTQATWSPDLSSPTNNFDSTTSPGVSILTTTDGVDYTSPKTQEENDLPVGATVGGIVAVIAVVIIVVVVVAVFVKRKKKHKSRGNAQGSSNDASNENDDFEEHINPMYVTNDGQDDIHSTDHKPSAIALRISSNSHNGHPAAPDLLDADIYTTVDGEARHSPSYQASGMGDRSGGYEDIGFGSNGSKRVPQKDEYAVVDKSRAKKGPASSANTNISSPAHTTEGSDEYAVVDKSSSRNKTAKTVASGLSDAATNNAGADVYAQVNKPAKKVRVTEPETEGAAYAQVQKPKPAVKPKTSAKPSSNKDATQRSAADDDEYHTLRHTRGSPETQEQAELESQYSHIGHD